MLDLSEIPVIDVHCHPFLDQGQMDEKRFTDLVSFPGGNYEFLAQSGLEIDDNVIEEIQNARHNLVYFRYLVHQLASYFGCDPDLKQIIENRNKAIQDYRGYVKILFQDCALNGLVVDFGYPVNPQIEVPHFAEDMPVEVVPLFRIEPLIAQLLKEDIDWKEFKQRFDQTIADSLEHKGYRGLKSIIAYRTGLDISPLSRTPDQGLQAWDAVRRGIGGQAMKKLRDHLLCRSLEFSIEYDVPMQIHTGMGDYEVNLVLCRPSLLMDMLRFPTFRVCKVILVHSGYPYHAEAGYMANMLPRVYCDVSEGIPFAGNGARRIYAELLEMTPYSKILYGSDGFTLPETNYIGAKLGKAALTQALNELVGGHMLSNAEALEAARLILSENTRRLYKMD